MSKNRYNTQEPQVPECQDWTTVTLNKKKWTSASESSRPESISSATQGSASAVVAAITKATDGETKKTKYIAKITSDAVRDSRCEKKITQKELAQKCNMDVSIISDIERGTCVYNASHINKIQTVLNVKIPRGN
jgi:ribosome-binding protein aMBF1 (putative translation factor)